MNIGETDGAIMSDAKPGAKNTFTIEEIQVELDAAHFAQEHCRSLWGAARGHSDWRKTHDGFIAGYKAKNAALQAEIEAMRKDAERLDWVQRNLLSADFEYEYQPGKTRPVLIIAWPRDVAIGGNARMNFDAAIAKEKQQESLK